MGVFTRGHLVVVSFPFSDLSGSKLRPALVIGKATQGDYILCQLTSKDYHTDGIEIDPQKDVSNGKLRGTSYVRPLKIFTANGSLIKGKIGELGDQKLTMTVEQIKHAIDP